MNIANFINGEFKAPKKTIKHVSPVKGAAEVELPDSDLLDVVQAIQAANKAAANWSKTDELTRSKFLEAFANEIEKRSEAFAQAQALDVGVPVSATTKHSVPEAASGLRAIARAILDLRLETITSVNSVAIANRLPGTTVGIITSFSDSIVTLSHRVGAAFANGSCVIAKPSSKAPRTAQLIAECLSSAGLPSGVFNLVQGRGDEVGKAIAQHPGLSTLAFVGTDPVARSIARDAAENLKRVHYSLGSKNPVLVFAGVDLAKTIPMVAQASLGMHPSVALRGSRIFVQETIYEEFRSKFAEEIAKIKVGDPMLKETQLGPLPTRAIFERFNQAAAQATGEKGKVLSGASADENGKDALKEGLYAQPIAIYDLTNCSTLQQEEVIGPFVTVTSFKYQHDAIKHANTSPYGHSAYVFENSLGKAHRVAQKLEVGYITVNSGLTLSESELHVSALKTSGLGGWGVLDLLDFFGRRTLIRQSLLP